MRVNEIAADAIESLAGRYCIAVEFVDDSTTIEDSYWGTPEAGISRAGLRLRGDTPVHSLLHELCHIVCMTAARRHSMQRDAGGTDEEECGVCYLQVLLADQLPGFSSARCLADMDAWGYSFREGSAAAWFTGDGRDAREWLRSHALIDADDAPTFHLRE
jgi:hypothetical protein